MSFLSLFFFGIPCFFSPARNSLFFFEFFSLLFRGSQGFGRDKNPCFFLGGFPCNFPKKQGKEGQGCYTLGSVFGRTNFLRIFLHGPPDFFADFAAGSFSPHFCGEKVPGKILQESAQENPTKFYTKNPRHISAEGPGQYTNQKNSRKLRSPRGVTDFPATILLARKRPNLGRDSISCFRKIGESFSSSVPENPSSKEFRTATASSSFASAVLTSEIRWWPPPPTYKAKIWTNIWIKFGPKCFKIRQIRQFEGHIFVHIFALYVGVGVAKRIPIILKTQNGLTKDNLMAKFIGGGSRAAQRSLV